ncbi:MAG: DUF1641 domain-containing protein [Terracidiphilus sp.]
MAQPIPLQLPPSDPRKELIDKLEQAPAEHAAALLDAYALMQDLHDKRVFTTLRGALSASDHIVETAVHAAESPESIHALRNAIILGRMLSSINPELLQCIATAVGETLGSERKPVIEPPGLFSLLRQFRQTELRRSIALINRFLDVLGDQLKKNGARTPHN